MLMKVHGLAHWIVIVGRVLSKFYLVCVRSHSNSGRWLIRCLQIDDLSLYFAAHSCQRFQIILKSLRRNNGSS